MKEVDYRCPTLPYRRQLRKQCCWHGVGRENLSFPLGIVNCQLLDYKGPCACVHCQLSFHMVGLLGLEPRTDYRLKAGCLAVKLQSRMWSLAQDSNLDLAD
jgi:hypothetical protein